jgi:hypothetical protein
MLPMAIGAVTLWASPRQSGRIGCMEPLLYELIVIGSALGTAVWMESRG